MLRSTVRAPGSACARQRSCVGRITPAPAAFHGTAQRTLRLRVAAMKQLINAPDAVVTEALDGLVLSHAHLQRLDGWPEIKVVFDKHHDKNKVAIISGGGSGHEPAHAGYVGSGMLSAAVCGEVFASPSAEAVLAAIRTVAGPAGCLVILKNYTGDRLHFGLAAEQAKAEGRKVEVVVVAEDVAIEEPGLAGRRGLAGVALVHKIAGAAAASGASLQEVAAIATKAAAAQGTLGVALRVCTLPGKETSGRLGENEVEVGLGIHGEPGVAKMSMTSADKLVQHMLTIITESRHFGALKQGERVVLVVNNLGGTTPLEMSVVTRAAIRQLKEAHGAVVERVFSGPLVTSLDMAGVSLTLLSVDQAGGDEVLRLLDHPVGAPGWAQVGVMKVNPDADKPVTVPGAPGGADEAHTAKRPFQINPEGEVLERVVAAAASALLEATGRIDELDGKVGDGDCGSTLARGAHAVLADVKTKYDLNRPALAASQLALSIRHSIGGTSGALYDVFFTAAAAVLKEAGAELSPKVWAAAFKAGADAVSKYGGAKRGSRTMLDALLPAADAAAQAAQSGEGAVAVAAKAAEAAAAGAESTKGMKASAGRASYVPAEVMASVPDPGATAVTVWLQAVAQALKEGQH